MDEVREYETMVRKHQVVIETGDGRWDNPVPLNSLEAIEKARDFRLVTKYQLMPVSTEESGLGKWRNQMVHLHQWVKSKKKMVHHPFPTNPTALI